MKRLMIAARCCGAAARLIEEATSFARERMIEGRPLLEREWVQFTLADSATELWAARLMTFEAADAHDRGEDVKTLHSRCSMAKLYASQVAERITSQAIEHYGGYGYTKDFPVEKFWRDAKIGSIYEGTSNMQLQTIAKYLLKDG